MNRPYERIFSKIWIAYFFDYFCVLNKINVKLIN